LKNFKNLQNYSKSISTLAVYIMAISMILSISSSNVYAAQKDIRFSSSADCKDGMEPRTGMIYTTCCWREPVPGKILGQVYCQTCVKDSNDCYDKIAQDFTKTPESTRPSDNDQVLEDQQTEQPSIKSNQGIILEERTIETDSQQNPSFDGEVETSSEITESENPSSSSETSNSEQTTNFAKKGNGQNSPVPPECPKQGPIPPDCTMKPKF
jgi:hypothetical protein